MTDKERLSQLKNGSVFDNDDINWLLQQAERVKDLEVWEETARNYFGENASLQEENKRYLEALEFYADKSIYNIYYDEVGIVGEDGGNKARQAIKGEKNV